MNVYDAETMHAVLASAGYRPVERAEEAGVVVITTCAVRESAEERIWGRLGEFKNWKAKREGRKVVVTGCMAENLGEAIWKRAPFVDLLVGTANFERVAELLDEQSRETRPLSALGVPRGKIPVGFELPSIAMLAQQTGRQASKDAAPASAASAPRVEHPAAEGTGFATWIDRPATGLHSFVKIMEGCDHFCTYCIVPFTRGKERSRAAEEIERDVRRVVERGVREITLLGQNVNSYGKGLLPRVRFSDLLARLDAVPGLLRIRFTTSHPQDCPPDLIDAMRDLPRVCEHFHLPFQSGSDRILLAMNRKYSGEQYWELVQRVRAGVPGVSLTTDVIVGFPSETEEDFEATVRLLDRAQFDAAYLFKFSPREGTPAATMGGAVADDVQDRRLQALLRMQNRISARTSEAYVGRDVEVLVEGPSDRDPQKMVGRTRTFKTAVFSGDPAWRGSEVPVRVARSSTQTLHGEARVGVAV